MTYSFGPAFWSGIIYILFVATFMTIFELLFFTVFLGPKETNAANNYLKEIKKPTYDSGYIKIAIGSISVADDVYNKLNTLNLLDNYNVYVSCVNKTISTDDIIQYHPSSSIISSDSAYAILSYTNETDLNNALKNATNTTTSCKTQMITLYNNEIGLFTDLITNNKITDQVQSLLNVSIQREDALNSKINQDAIAFICLEIVILLLFIGLLWAMLRNSTTSADPVYWKSFRTGITPSLFSALICTLILILFQISMYQFGTKFNYPGDNELKYRVLTKVKTDLSL